MNRKEIERLRRKFIFISMISILLVMLFIGGIINAVSVTASRSAIRYALEGIVQSGGVMQRNNSEDNGQPVSPSVIEAFSPNFRHNHFFLFFISNDGLVLSASNTDDETERETVAEYAVSVSERTRSFGRYGGYYYLKSSDGNGEPVLAMIDCTTELAASLRLAAVTVATGAGALIITLILVLVLSGKMIRPEIENSNRQREFITNASHELKTPLAVIRANTELLEVTGGENEWTQSTLKQVDHMNGLIQNLVMIARAEEKESKTEMGEIDASRVIRETVSPYEASARQAEKLLKQDIEESVRLIGNESKLRQLTTILVDNAIKYCDNNGEITVSLSALRKGKPGMRLCVSNTFADGKDVDINRFFDRFYMEDSSHNIDKGGYGIGLSMAESICKQAGGSIKAVWKDGVISFICQLP